MFPNGALIKDINHGGFAINNVGTLNSSPLSGLINYVINGDFDFWQRGTSFSSPVNAQYMADRWTCNFDGTGITRTISQQVHTLGQTAVPGNPTYFFRVAQTVAGSGATQNQYQTRLEGVRTLSGKTATFTMYGQFASANTLPNIQIGQYFGTGGSPSATVYTTFATSIAVGTSWQKIQYVFSVPSISGKTIGTNNDDFLLINIGLPINTTFTFDISHISLVEGDASKEVDAFAPRHIDEELMLCQRYFIAMGGGPAYERFGIGVAVSTTIALVYVPFPTTMRASPTVTTSTVSLLGIYDGVTISALTAATLDQSSVHNFNFNVTVASGLTAGQLMQFSALNSTAARLYFSAEL